MADRAFERPPPDVAARGYQRREPVPLGRPAVRFFGGFGRDPVQIILPLKAEARNCAHRTAGVGRVEVWRGDVRLSMPVSAPFV